jgi:hypothetical protein
MEDYTSNLMNELNKKLQAKHKKEIKKLQAKHKKIGDKVFNINPKDQNAYCRGYGTGFHAGFFYALGIKNQ